MALSDRLDILRRQSGAVAADHTSNDDLRQRITRMQSRSYTSSRISSPSPRMADAKLAEQWGGVVAAPGLVLIERRISLTSRHGNTELSGLLMPLERVKETTEFSVEQLCFFDTETSGLSGGSGTVVFLLGMGRVIGNELVIRQYQLTTFNGEQAMLKEAANWLGEEGVLVSYNGKSFDAPLLTTRCRLTGSPDPWSRSAHIDLLHPTRRAFARRWQDCRLGTVERNLLGFRRQDDLPGSEVPYVWQEYLRLGTSTRVLKVIEHNFRDILSLAALLPTIEAVHRSPLRFNADIASIARYHLKRGEADNACEILRSNVDRLDDEARLLLSDIYRRQKRWNYAEPLLLQLAEKDNPDALERLAKHHEHKRRDYQSALCYAKRLTAQRHGRQRIKRLTEKLVLQGVQLPLTEG